MGRVEYAAAPLEILRAPPVGGRENRGDLRSPRVLRPWHAHCCSFGRSDLGSNMNNRRSVLLVAALGVACSGPGPVWGVPGTGGRGGASAVGGTLGEAGASTSSNAIAPAACEPTLGQGGAASMNDAEAPVNHRPTPLCCPAQRGPGPSGQPYPYCGVTAKICPSPFATTCASDSECTDGVNGRCFPFEGLVGPGGCSYDECFTDSDCGSKTPCLCRFSSTDNNANVCDVAGNCAVDSDCGPGRYCSPSVQIIPDQLANVCSGSGPYYCHTASDLCINDSDCAFLLDAGLPTSSSPIYAYACAYNPQDSRWECTQAFCGIP